MSLDNFNITQQDINAAIRAMNAGVFQIKVEEKVFINVNGGNSNIPSEFNQNYFPSQQNNFPWNIGDIPQQGEGSGNSETPAGGSGDNTPSTQPAGSVGEVKYNGSEINLDYFKQALYEQAETNLEGFFATFFSAGPMKNILENGKNSEYLSELDEEDATLLAQYVKVAYENAKNTLYLRNKSDVTTEDYQQLLIQAAGSVNDQVGFWGNVAELSGKLKSFTTTKKGVPLLAGIAALTTSFTSLYVADKDFKNRYPYAREMAWQEVIGHQPSFIEALNLSNRVKVNTEVRALDPDRFDKIELTRIDYYASILPAFFDILAGIAVILDPRAKEVAPIIAGASLTFTGWFGLFSAASKTMYLNKVRPYEADSFWGQLFGVGFGGAFEDTFSNLKKMFNGTENSSSSQNGVDPTSNPLKSNLLKSSNLRTVAVETTDVFSGSADNDTLMNVEDNYFIDAGDGDDEIINVGDNATVDCGNGNDYVVNLGDNVKINDVADNNKIDNAGVNVTINVADGDNYVGNSGNSVTIQAGNGNNYVDNVGNSVDIRLGNGSNDVENFGSNVTVSTGNSVDFIVNYGSDTTINSGSGNDVVYNSYSSNVVINTEADDDYISNGSLSSGVTINAGDGADIINNRASIVSINAGNGDNKIANDGVSVTMVSGDGADTVANAGNSAFINASNGNNSIGNAGDNVSIFAGIGTDTIINEGNNVKINVTGGANAIINKGVALSMVAENGNNTIQNYGETSNIKSGGGADVIANGAIETTIDGGNGADTIINYFAMQVDDNENFVSVLANGNNVLINGGADSDLIENYGSFVTINGGDGNDTIKNFGFILIDQNGNIIRTAAVSNYYYQIDAGEGTNYVYNENESATITSGTGDDSIENIANNVNINAGDGSNTIKNLGSNVNINVGNGFNTIANIGSTVVIQSGSGNDSIESEGINVEISSGAGNDFIHNYSNGSNTTINAGTGDDTISLDAGVQNNVIKYKVGDGNKIIYGYNSTTTIKVNGSGFNTTANGNDMIVTIGEGTITLKDTSGISSLHIIRDDEPDARLIKGTEGADTINNSLADSTINALGGDDSIYNDYENVSINADTGDDTIKNGWLGSNVTVDSGIGNDSIENRGDSSLIKSGAGEDFIYNIGGKVTIDSGIGNDSIENRGDNSLIKSGAGEDSIYNIGGKVIIDSGIGDDTIINYGDNVDINANEGNDFINNAGSNVTITGGAGDDTIKNFGHMNATFIYANGDGNDTVYDLNSNDVLKIDGNYKVMRQYDDVYIIVDNGSILIKDYIGNTLNINETFVTIPNEELINLTDVTDSVHNEISGAKINALGGNDSIENSGSNVTINGNSGNDTIYNGHIVVSEIFTPFGDRTTVYSSGGTNVSINGGEDDDYISNKVYEWNSSEQEYQRTSSPVNNTLLGGTGNDTIENFDGSVMISGGIGNDSIKNMNSNVTIDGGENNDTVENYYNSDVSINGGAGDDSINNERLENSAGKTVKSPDRVTIIGGDGNDKIKNHGRYLSIDGGNGDDVINNGFPTDDIGSNVTISGGAGSDTIINYGNSVSIDAGADNDFIGGSGSYVTINAGDGNDTISNGGTSNIINAGAGDDSISNTYASNSSVFGGTGNDTVRLIGGENETVDGGAGDDYIVNGNGINPASSNLTINGGTGNDTIENIDGANVTFTYAEGDGNDVISGFNGTSTLYITSGNVSDVSNRDNDVVLTVGDGTITLKDAAGILINYKVGNGELQSTIPTDSVVINDPNNISGSENYTITSGGDYYIQSGYTGTITINTTSAVTIDGAGAGELSNVNIAVSSTNADLTIKDLNITNDTHQNIIKFGSDTTNKLTIMGSNSIINTAATSSAGIYIGGGLSIDGDGSLNVEVTGTVTAIGLNFGEKSSADININGGKFIITSSDYSGAGIGSGVQGSIGNITIGGNAYIQVTSSTFGAGIGSALFGSVGNITIKDNVKIIASNPYGGACIGSGGSGSAGNITITDNANISATGTGGAAIGAGSSGIAGDITIAGNSVVNTIADGAAGIGSGYANGGNDNTPTATSSIGNITIKENATVTSISNVGAAIGSGSAYWGFTNAGNIEIYDKAVVNAYIDNPNGSTHIGSKCGTGIGIGYTGHDSKSTLGSIYIGGDATVTASAGENGAVGIGSYPSDYSSGINEIGSITFSSDASTSSKSVVTINNTDDKQNITINGYVYSGSRLIFNDGVCNEAKTITGSSVADNITNTIRGATINALGGNDSIENSGNNSSINGGDGDDRIINSASDVTVYGGAGNDYISLSGGNNVIIGGMGNDTIYGYSSTDALQIEGEIKATRNGKDVLINGGTGSILIKDFSENSLTINNTAVSVEDTTPVTPDQPSEPEDTVTSVIVNGKTYELLSSYKNDTYELDVNEKTIVNIDASKVNHGIEITGNGKINKIIGSNYDDTIAGGKGIDYVTGGDGEDIFVYSLGDGNDTILDYTEDEDKIQIKDYDDLEEIVKSASIKDADVIFKVGTGRITVKDAAEKRIYFFNEESGTDIEYPIHEPVSLNASKTIAVIFEDYQDGQFYAKDYGSGLKTINGAAASTALDIIGNALPNSIVGGKYNDCIIGGKGADILFGGEGSDIFVYNSGDASDVILDYTEGEDKIQINLSAEDVKDIRGSAVINDDDVIFVIGTSKITVKNAKDKKIILLDEDGQDYEYPDPSPVKINSTKTSAEIHEGYDKDVFLATEYGSKLKNIDASTLGKDSSITIKGNALSNKIIGSESDDCIIGGRGMDTLIGGNGHDTFLYNIGDGNDIVLDYNTNDDNEADVIKINLTADDVEDIRDNASINGSDVVFFIGTGKITVKDAKDKKIILKDENDEEHQYPNPLPVSLNETKTNATILDTYADKTFIAANFRFGSKLKKIDASAVPNELEITGNSLSNKIIGTSGDDVITGAKGNDTLTGGDGSDIFVYNFKDGNDVITDYTEGEDKIQINDADLETVVRSATIKGGDVSFKIASNTITVKDAAEKAVTFITYIDGEETEIEYPIYDPVVFNETKTAATILEKFTDEEYSIKYYSKVKSVDASRAGIDEQGLKLEGNSLSNKIIGTAYDDTIEGAKGNDTLTGGFGADIFVYAPGDGNDVITDYTEGEDKIQIKDYSDLEAIVKSYTVKGGDVSFKIASNTITVKDGAEKTVTFINSDDGVEKEVSYPIYEPYTLDEKKTVITLKEDYAGNTFNYVEYVDFGSRLKTIDGGAVNHGLEIVGNKLSNSIVGTAYNDTIEGGGLGDTLFGGDGSDIFVYSNGDGKDVILDYNPDDEDKIQIKNYADIEVIIESAGVKDADVIFKIDKGQITVKDAADKTITFIDNNKNEYYYNALAESADLVDDYWFDDNAQFSNEDAQIDSLLEITDTNYSVGKFEQAENFATLTNDSLDTTAVYTNK